MLRTKIDIIKVPLDWEGRNYEDIKKVIFEIDKKN